MTRTTCATALLAVALCSGATAAAQDRPIVSVLPPAPSRVDITAQVGWLGSNKSGIGADWDDWYSAAAGSVTVGYYLTPHLKAELSTSFASEGRIFGQELTPIPGEPYPFYRVREHYFSSSALGGGTSYQFLENQWFHPFAGAGIELVRETHRTVVPSQTVPSRKPGSPTVLPASGATRERAYAARPFLSAGFKLYMSERAFVRSDLRSTFASRGAAHLVWSAGIGVDL
jgi:hypothetical protein